MRKSRRARPIKNSAQAKPADDTAAIDRPTSEQDAKVVYRREIHTDEMGARVGAGYRREPLFETIAKGKANAITRDELTALRFYRAAFDRCERSLTKSCLAFGAGGTMRDPASSMISATPAIIEAKRKVRLCEDAVGKWIGTVRAVALDDRTFTDIAIERFGGRKQDWILTHKPVLKNGRPVKVDGKPLTAAVTEERIVPRSGRHREIIRQEFLSGLRLLTKRFRTLTRMHGIEEVWVEPGTGASSIRRGVNAPNGLYRLWGDADRIDDLMSRLRDLHGEGLSFATPQGARAALDEADGGRLSRLSEVELAP